ncbi:unnamed protein product [Blepharisma stoltei]|uniref:Uncharacterized protein n=1 Tax=Blepharisma stoltei TaxID=1481888 RepID=A0AAU9JHW9_9CILI|nr:unnamed protein product [Blepharisma stoltei]
METQQPEFGFPFNPSHHMKTNRIIWHMLKCSKNQSESSKKTLAKVQCSYNKEHWIEQAESFEHMQHECSDRLTEFQNIKILISQIQLLNPNWRT